VKSIDLFAGGAGMTEGFKQAGFNSIFCNEFEKNAVNTCKLNHTSALVNDKNIRDLDVKEVREHLKIRRGELDVLIGGPPCQGFSTYGKRDGNDPRNQLYLNYIEFLDEFRPKTFVIENVAGLLSMSKGDVLDDICTRISALGYDFDVNVLNAANFGVPQKRKRVFIVGASDGQKIERPNATHCMELPSNQGALVDCLLPYETVQTAISDLKNNKVLLPKLTQQFVEYNEEAESHYQKLLRGDNTKVSHHSSKQMLGIRRLRLALLNPGEYGTEIIKRAENQGLPNDVIDEILNGGEGVRDSKGCRKEDIEKEYILRKLLNEGQHTIEEIINSIDSGGFKNKYRRLQWDKPSHTLVAHMSRDCSDFIHPSKDRFISVREAARLQSFSDSYQFVGSQFQQFLQIGNAVPPMLAKAVALPLVKVLANNCNSKAA
jgi:DNA (cytosine-5)-methyltransferase 1